jgi:uncharacterized protein (TIGR03067 family)
MKAFIATICCFTLAALLISVAGGGEKTTAKVEGTWAVTAGSSDGKKLPDEVIAKAMVSVVFKDGGYKVTGMGMQIEAGTYKVDASKKPATIDMTITEGGGVEKSQVGIFKLEGDVLTLAIGAAGVKDRPKNFDGGDKIEITVMKRSK